LSKVNSRWISPSAVPVTRDDVPGATAYVEKSRNGRYLVKGFRSERVIHEDFFVSFSDYEKAEKYISHWFDKLVQRCQDKQARQESRRQLQEQPNPFHEGDILCYSWGYEQTNCEFYQVVRVQGKKVTLRRVASKSVSSEGLHSMAEFRVALKDAFIEDYHPLNKLVQFLKDGGAYVSMDHGIATKWNGDKQYSSWYA
jgi:hypothetical protein